MTKSEELSHDEIRKIEEYDRIVQNYTQSFRNEKLIDTFSKNFKNENINKIKNDYNDKIFDWERDMNSSVKRMSAKSTNELLSKSKLDDRFSSLKKYL